MARLPVREEVGQAFPGVRIIAVVALGFDGRRPWPEVEAQLAALEDSEQIVFLLETVDAGAFGTRLDDARRSLTRLLADRSRTILFHEIAAADPDILALVPEWESGPGVDVDLRSGT
jgi:hypothetical protein